MKVCKKCVMPNTKPDLHFDDEGVCDACKSQQYKNGIIDYYSFVTSLCCISHIAFTLKNENMKKNSFFYKLRKTLTHLNNYNNEVSDQKVIENLINTKR